MRVYEMQNSFLQEKPWAASSAQAWASFPARMGKGNIPPDDVTSLLTRLDRSETSADPGADGIRR